MSSALGWAGVVPVAVPLTNLSIPAVDQDLRLLVSSDLSGLGDCLGLGRVDARDSAVTLAPDSPSAIVGDDMLVLAHQKFSMRKEASSGQISIMPGRMASSQDLSISTGWSHAEVLLTSSRVVV